MHRFRVLATVVGLIGICADGKAAEPTKDRDALQGTWTLVSLQVDGYAMPEEIVKTGRFVVESDQYKLTLGVEGISADFTYVLDPTSTPRSIDLTYASGPRKGATVKGIYRLQGDSYTLCRRENKGQARPTEFVSKPGSGLILAVYKRERTKSKPDAEKKADPAQEGEVAKFQGTWRLVSGLTDGKPLPDEKATQITVTITGNKHTVRMGDAVIARDVSFEVDPRATPKAVTDTIQDGPQKGTVIRGIYKFEGDTLVSCVPAAGKDRPTKFDGGPGTGCSLRVFKREPAASNAAIDAEHTKFEGTWAFESVEIEGKALALEQFQASRLTLKGKTFTYVDGNGTSRGTYALDLSKSPKTIDVTFTEGPNSGEVMRGVYELEGDKYKACVALGGKPRPSGFVSAPGSGHVLEVLKRQKP
jgi:uncharacterized protein (TIGR03067 family)